MLIVQRDRHLFVPVKYSVSGIFHQNVYSFRGLRGTFLQTWWRKNLTQDTSHRMFGAGMSSPLVSWGAQTPCYPQDHECPGQLDQLLRQREANFTVFLPHLSISPSNPSSSLQVGSTVLIPEIRKNQRGEISSIYSSVLVSHAMISSSKSDIVVYLQIWGLTNSCKSNPKCVLFLQNTTLCILMEYSTALCEIQMNGLLLPSQKSGLEVVPHNALWLEHEVRPAVFPSVSTIFEWFDLYKNYAIFH